MSHRKLPDRVVLSREEWESHLAEDERVRRRVAELEAKLAAQDGRAPPPPSWVKANVEMPPEGQRKKRGAKFGHEPHHRPPPPLVHETVDVTTPECPDCGDDLGAPFAFDDHLVEAIVPGHVRVTRYRIGRYRCRTCRKVRRARLAPDIVPGTSRFSWGTHFLVGYWPDA